MKLKRLVAVALFLSMILSLNSAAIEVASEPDYEALMMAQQGAVMAHEALMASFTPTPEGYDYPENFGGDFIEDNKLVVLLVSLSNANIQYYANILSEYIDIVEFRSVDYSYNELSEEVKATVDSMNENYSVTKSYVDIKENRAKICLSPESYAEYVHQALSYSVEASKVIVEEENREFGCAQTGVATKSSISLMPAASVSLVGGMKIMANNSGGGYSLGICGKVGSESAFLTCGHLLELSEGISDQATGYRIGTVTNVYGGTGGGTYGDFAVVATNSNAVLTNTAKYGSTGTVTIGGTCDSPAVGSIVNVQGGYGNHTYGEVTNVGVGATDEDYGLTFTKLTEMLIYSGTINQGDSGAPYWIYQTSSDGTTVRAFCGIQSGVAPGYSYFTPYYYPHYQGFFDVKTS